MTVSTAARDTHPLVRKTGYALGPLFFLMTLLLPPPGGMAPEAWTVAGLALWMAIWWMTEAVPLPVTSLLPIVLLPLAEVMPVKDAVMPYANPVIFLFFGGFLIAIAIQKCNLHLRIALSIVRVIGTRPDRMIGGFMAAAAFLSMWISNTATMLMMLPICLSVVDLLKEKLEREEEGMARRFAVCMLLGIAYASSIGGVGTLIGTPPNAIMSGYMQQIYGLKIGFLEWMLAGVPMAVVMTALMWWVMTRWLFRIPLTDGRASRDIINAELAKLGAMSRDEKMAAGVACATAALWILHPLVSRVVPIAFDDTVIAMLGALALFVIPVDRRALRFALTWKDAERVPWGVLILFGGGLSLAGGFEHSGLAQWIGGGFAEAVDWPPLLTLAAVVLAIMIATTLMSNVASINIFLPIVVPMAVGMGMHPLFLAIPATMAASCAFMLPVSTANNAIAFGTGHVSIGEMARAGLWLNLIALPVLIALAYVVVMPVFGIDPGHVPDWAKTSP